VVSSDRFSGRLIFDPPRTGSFNMAADYYLAEESQLAGMLSLRLYSWEEPTLSLGFHQKLPKEVVARCRQQGIPIVRRPTGGRAVLHDNELTYCLAIPDNHSIFIDNRGEVLRTIGEIFVVVAHEAGLEAQLVRASNSTAAKPENLKKGSPLCFDAVSRWEVQLDGSKWIGSAQRFLPGGLLQHGSIRMGENAVDLNQLFGLEDTDNKTDISIEPATCARLRVEIPKAFANAWNLDWEEVSFNRDDILKIDAMSDGYMYPKSDVISIRKSA
jgi:lipoate-protein ligase A